MYIDSYVLTVRTAGTYYAPRVASIETNSLFKLTPFPARRRQLALGEYAAHAAAGNPMNYGLKVASLP